MEVHKKQAAKNALIQQTNNIAINNNNKIIEQQCCVWCFWQPWINIHRTHTSVCEINSVLLVVDCYKQPLKQQTCNKQNTVYCLQTPVSSPECMKADKRCKTGPVLRDSRGHIG
ncbi:unnamed protein product [Polarella glacialis]|uniref:Uncharacterized protein n=1 Tax=Polarella glacialis TaxID=89957 RepID=A0A813G6Q8_POLGL|nr:unnamed protein product [Polarella glacialis]